MLAAWTAATAMMGMAATATVARMVTAMMVTATMATMATVTVMTATMTVRLSLGQARCDRWTAPKAHSARP